MASGRVIRGRSSATQILRSFRGEPPALASYGATFSHPPLLSTPPPAQHSLACAPTDSTIPRWLASLLPPPPHLPHSHTALPFLSSVATLPLSHGQQAPLRLSPSPSHGRPHCSGTKESTPESDDDFKPQYRKPEELPPMHKLIQQDITENPVMVYMKGTPSMPMCGFSGGVVQILKAYGVEFKSRNVLEDPELRQGIKSFSQWPTIPQVFVNGEFLGGCDLLFKMHEDGELENLFAKVRSSADAKSDA